MKRGFTTSILVVIFNAVVFATTNTASDFPQGAAKLYLQTDRESYFVGDTIWAKAFLLDDSLPENGNNIIVVALKSLVSSQAVNYKFYGDKYGIPLMMPIPYNIQGGTYSLMAGTTATGTYTFKKNIEIYDVNHAGREILFEEELKFYPEGGRLIAGIKNRVAFKMRWGHYFFRFITL